MAVYIAGYGVGRLWVESLRIDPANEIAGLRINQWMAILAIVGGVAYTVWAVRRDGVTRQPAAAPAFVSGE
jgi:prolipoprotein diacylglyceryltransferase